MDERWDNVILRDGGSGDVIGHDSWMSGEASTSLVPALMYLAFPCSQMVGSSVMQQQFKRNLYMMDSMTDAELDGKVIGVFGWQSPWIVMPSVSQAKWEEGYSLMVLCVGNGFMQFSARFCPSLLLGDSGDKWKRQSGVVSRS